MRKQLDTQVLGDIFETLDEEEVLGFDRDVFSRLSGVVSRFGQNHQAIVQSAVTLTASEKKAIERFLKKISRNTIKIYFRLQPSLLGGVKITVGDWKLDGSLVHQIETMKHYLLT